MKHVTALLERRVPVLIYVGTDDWICNFIGQEIWTAELDWSGREAFNAQNLRNWTVNGSVAGKTKSANGLTLLTVFDAGHMVPTDKPLQALAMVRRWIDGKDF